MLRTISVGTRKFFQDTQIDYFPIRKTIKNYSAEKAKADSRAGLNVAIMGFPQGMAYALIAGLPIEYGMYCFAIASIVGACFASSRFTSVGPTNATAVMVLSSFLILPQDVNRLEFVGLMVLMVGLFLIAGAYLKVAVLTQYVSRSVIVGYITGAALLIIANQVQHVLGFSLGEVTTFFGVCKATILKLTETNFLSLEVALLTFAIWFFCQVRLKSYPGVALTLIVVAAIVAFFGRNGSTVAMLNSVHSSHWTVTFPQFDLTWFNRLTMPAMAIAFLAMLEGTFMAKMLANRTGERVDVNQEMFSFGMANVCSSLFSGMPASGSLTRSTLSSDSGAMTPMSHIFCGLISLLGIIVLGPLVRYIPKAALAVVVICVAVSLINRHSIRISLKATKSDAIVLMTTFVASLITPLYFAIFLGTATSIALFLRKAGSPRLVEYSFGDKGELRELKRFEQRRDSQISIIQVEGDLFFGAADLFRDEIRKVCNEPSTKVVILRMRNARNLDATSVMALEDLLRFMNETGRRLMMSGVSHDIYRVLRNSGLIAMLGRENLFSASRRNPTLATRNALKRAQRLIGKDDLSVRVFSSQKEQTDQLIEKQSHFQ
jgi:sulfate permease, SulP family